MIGRHQGRLVNGLSISSTTSQKETRVSAALTSDEETPVEDEGTVGVSRGVDDNLTSLVFTACIIQHLRLSNALREPSKEKPSQLDKI